MLLIPLTHLLDGILLLVAVGRVEFLAELMRLACLTPKTTSKRPGAPAARTQRKRQKKKHRTQTGRHAGSSSRRAAGRCQR